MNRKGGWILASLAFFLCATSLSAYKKYQVVGGPKDFYYGHISFVDADSAGKGPTIWRDGTAAPEPAVVNAPLGPGDLIMTPDGLRCEIQFDTGTIVRLDVGTELKIETVNARSLSTSKGLSNLVLTKGRVYVMYREYDSREVFQILTPNAAVKLDHKTVAMVKASADGTTEVQVKAGKASTLFGASAGERRDKPVKKLERLIVLADNQFQAADYIADTEFEKWNDEINAHFEEMHEGKSALPKPIQTLPDAVFYFAQKYGSVYGEWVWDSFLGYVWRPYVDQVTPGGGWQPYVNGYWTSAAGQLFWIPSEPWGWVPYHLGIWHWDTKLGWVWMPGALFASAWAEWDFFEGNFSWRPWGFADWYGLDELAYGLWSPYNFLSGGIWPPGSVNANSGLPWHQGSSNPVLYRITKDQLKKGDVQALPIPKELKNAYKSFVAALGRKDDRALSSLRAIIDKTVFVPKSEVNSTHLEGKLLTWSQVRQTARPQPAAGVSGSIRNSYRDAVQVLAASRAAEEAGKPAAMDPFPQSMNGPVLHGPSGPVRMSIGDVGLRFRDWNPDIPIAQKLGVSIRYSSQLNVIRCPELRLSSHEVSRFGARLSPYGVWSPFDGGSYSYSGSANSPGNSPMSNTPHGGTPTSAGHGGGGGDVKKN
jgi:hypothetical protein